MGSGREFSPILSRESLSPLRRGLYRPGVPRQRHTPVEDRRGGVCLRDPSLRRSLRIVVHPPLGGVDGHRLRLHLHPVRGSRSIAAARLDSLADRRRQRGDRALHGDAATGSSQEAACGTGTSVAIPVPPRGVLAIKVLSRIMGGPPPPP